MIKLNLDFLRAQLPIKPIEDPSEIDKQYRRWRSSVFWSIYVGYGVFYFCRKNLGVAFPSLMADLHLTKTEAGAISTAIYITYGLGKFGSGILGDRANPRYFMALGLVLTGITNICFGMSSTLTSLILLWALNGVFQSMGWAPCVKTLTQWFSQSERGNKWSRWHTSLNLATGLILAGGGWTAQHYGWRYTMMIPGLICLVCAVYIVYGLRDSPESVGLPSIEKYRNDYPANYDKSGLSHKMPIWAVLNKYVFNKKAMWFLAIGNFFAYIVRFGVVDWAPTYLVEVRGVSLSFASIQTMTFEAVGILGSLFAGYYSDRFFKGRRAYFNALLLSVLFIILLAFPWLPAGMALADASLLGFMGFLIYGPLMLVSISAADISGKFAAGAATGFTGLFGYLGSSVSGSGTGYIIDQYGWLGCFQFFGLCSALSAICFLCSLEGGFSFLRLRRKK